MLVKLTFFSLKCFKNVRQKVGLCDSSQFSSEWSGQSATPLQNCSRGRQMSSLRQGLVPSGQRGSELQSLPLTRRWSWAQWHVIPPGNARQRWLQPPLPLEQRLVPKIRNGLIKFHGFFFFYIYIFMPLDRTEERQDRREEWDQEMTVRNQTCVSTWATRLCYHCIMAPTMLNCPQLF